MERLLRVDAGQEFEGGVVVARGGALELRLRDLLVVGVGVEDVAGTDEQRRAPVGHVRRVGAEGDLDRGLARRDVELDGGGFTKLLSK